MAQAANRAEAGTPARTNGGARGHAAAANRHVSQVPRSHRSKVTVGIDLGPEALRLVKSTLGSDGHVRIAAVAQVARPPDMTPESPEFAEWLGTAVTRFCGGKAGCALWVCLPDSVRSTVARLTIPDVPRSQIGNAVFWAVRKESPFVEDETILDYEVEGPAVQDGLPRIAVNAYTVPRSDVEQSRALFARANLPLAGITLPPSICRNLLRAGWVAAPASGALMFLDIAQEDSRITIVTKGSVVLSRGIRSGLNSLLEPLVTDPEANRSGPEARELLATFDWDSSFDTQAVRAATAATAGAAAPLAKREPEGVNALVLPALKRLVGNILRTLEYHSSDLKAEGIDTVCVSGDILAFRPVMEYIGAQLGCTVQVLDPFAGGQVAPNTALPDPASAPAFGPAAALSLSGEYPTVNLLATRVDEDRFRATQSTNWWVVGVFALFAAAVLGGYYRLGLEVRRKEAERRSLADRLERSGRTVGIETLQALAQKAKAAQVAAAARCRDYQSLAIIQEVFALTPPAVRLLTLEADLSAVPVPPPPAPGTPPGTGAGAAGGGALGGLKTSAQSTVDKAVAPPPPPAVTAGGAAASKRNSVTLEGVVPGDPQAALSQLALFIHSLDRSPLLEDPKLEESAVDTGDGEALLRFKVRATVVEFQPQPAATPGATASNVQR